MKKLLAFTATLLLLVGAESALADDPDGWNSHRGTSPGLDRNLHDNGWNGAWGRNSRNDQRWNDSRYDRDHDNVSVNAGFGNAWRPAYRDYNWNSFNTFGVGIGYNNFRRNNFTNWGSPFANRGYPNHRPVVVYQNTYIDNPAPRTRVTTRSTVRTGKSLLRDVNGRCFERETDRRGNETRTELPAQYCNF